VFAIRSVPETGSTNHDALAILGEPGSAGVVLLTDYQRAGRGRRARAWVAPPGSALLFTAILPEPLASSALWALPFWTALGVADGIERRTGLRAGLQWPNDLLLEGRKCCGILCVSRVAGERAWTGCGVGLNVNRPPNDEQLAEIVPPPAFLSDSAGTLERGALLDAILAAFERRFGDLDEPRAIARAWEARAGLAGTRYRLLLDGSSEPFEATARGLGEDGALLIDEGAGTRAIALAEARVLR